MKENLVKRFFTGTGTTYDVVVNLFTYGADRYWKRKILSKIPQGQNILDLACGTGILTFRLAQRNSCSNIIGVDMMQEYLAEARLKIQRNGCSKVHFICARAEEVQLRATFDCITSSYIPKYVPAEVLLENIAPYLKPGGKLILHDFAYPTNFIFRRIWEFHMSLMRMVGPSFFPQWKTVFYELRDLVRTATWISDYLDAMQRHGFQNIEKTELTAGSAAIVSAIKIPHFVDSEVSYSSNM